MTSGSDAPTSTTSITSRRPPAAAPEGGGVRFEPMGRPHLDAVHRLETAVSPDPWSFDLLADELADDGATDRQWLVALADDQRLVGFGGVLRMADEAHVMNLVVDPAERRRGLASRLLARLLLAAADQGSVAATLEVRAGNEAALALYRSFGFETAGRRPHYYSNGDDAEIMWLHHLYRPAVRARIETLGAVDD